MAEADGSKLSKTKNLLRNIHQSHDYLQPGKADSDRNGYQAN